jgi:hypothetical protein
MKILLLLLLSVMLPKLVLLPLLLPLLLEAGGWLRDEADLSLFPDVPTLMLPLLLPSAAAAAGTRVSVELSLFAPTPAAGCDTFCAKLPCCTARLRSFSFHFSCKRARTGRMDFTIFVSKNSNLL